MNEVTAACTTPGNGPAYPPCYLLRQAPVLPGEIAGRLPRPSGPCRQGVKTAIEGWVCPVSAPEYQPREGLLP